VIEGGEGGIVEGERERSKVGKRTRLIMGLVVSTLRKPIGCRVFCEVDCLKRLRKFPMLKESSESEVSGESSSEEFPHF
jgi:hypothetical protein